MTLAVVWKYLSRQRARVLKIQNVCLRQDNAITESSVYKPVNVCLTLSTDSLSGKNLRKKIYGAFVATSLCLHRSANALKFYFLNLSRIPGSARTCCIFFVPINWCATVGHLIHRVNSIVNRADHSCDKITTTLHAWTWRYHMNHERMIYQLSGQKLATKVCGLFANCFELARNSLTFSVG